MSQTLDQIFIANPITSNASTDLMYFAQSPYTAGKDAGMTYANFNAQIVETGTINAIGYYAAAGNKISPITTVSNGVLITSNAGAPSYLANSGTPGFVLTANSGAPPSWQSLGAAILTWSSVAGTSQAAAVNKGYILLNVGQTTVTLPAVYAVGDVVTVVGSTANVGGWVITASTGDTIRVNNSTTSAGGTVTCTAVAGQCISLVCDVANTSWVMTSTSSVLLTTA